MEPLTSRSSPCASFIKYSSHTPFHQFSDDTLFFLRFLLFFLHITEKNITFVP